MNLSFRLLLILFGQRTTLGLFTRSEFASRAAVLETYGIKNRLRPAIRIRLTIIDTKTPRRKDEVFLYVLRGLD